MVNKKNLKNFWKGVGIYISLSPTLRSRNDYRGRGQCNGPCICNYSQSEVEFGILEKNTKRFILTYSTLLMDGGPLQKDLSTMAYDTPE